VFPGRRKGRLVIEAAHAGGRLDEAVFGSAFRVRAEYEAVGNFTLDERAFAEVPAGIIVGPRRSGNHAFQALGHAEEREL
jgi:hypothetical protein